MLSFYYHELMEKTEGNEGKKYVVIDDHMRDGVLDKIKIILCITKLDDNEILIDTYIKLTDKVARKNATALISCAVKDNDTLYLKLNSEEALVA